MDIALLKVVEAASGRLHPTPAAILRRLAIHENPARRAEGKPSSFPSAATLAAEVGVCRKTVTRVAKKLAGMGLISWERRPRRSNVYTLNAEALVALAATQPSKNVENVMDLVAKLGGQINVSSHKNQGKTQAAASCS